ncbi:sugar ABC transporter ATP-binding protein [Enterocloster sp. OA13]|uniref:sugar ABC transporter ATP-binding protein n=1 Tax=Enterocloster sp. OA13 TaxID=2914161 RepID=UPI0004AD0465|nr:sugar ABC transporter ATP-binding protein [Enterocloster sp. OA13]
MSRGKIILSMKGIVKEFPGVRALKGVDFSVAEGEVHALMGENGAGKSTLIKVLTGFYQKDGGSIEFDGRDINPRTVLEAQEEGISTIYQELNLVPFQTVYENMYLGRELMTRYRTIDRKRMISECGHILADLGIHVDVTRPLSDYGTAVQQMVAIGRAISVNAKLVIMDEPTSSLDTKEVEVLFGVIRKLKARNIAVIFISHRLDEIFEICERITILRDGALTGSVDIHEIDQRQLISAMIGKEAKQLERTKKGYLLEQAQVLAKMEGIRQGTRLNGLGIEIRKGEVVGLAGLLGAGRTELAKVLFGAAVPDKGTVYWMGKECRFRCPADAIASEMGFCTEDRKVEGILPHLSVSENLTVALLPKISRFGVIPRKRQAEIVDSYIKSLGIKTPGQGQAIRTLSGGNQQKVLLARWMCTDPKLIIMDEPTRGIDVGAKGEIEALIRELSEKGISILMISSEMAELERNCDRVVVIRDGRKMGELLGDEIRQDVIMEMIAGGGGDNE